MKSSIYLGLLYNPSMMLVTFSINTTISIVLHYPRYTLDPLVIMIFRSSFHITSVALLQNFAQYYYTALIR